jgi:outer membrane protein OmpA-like peptidoglycan-associated protein
MRRIPLIPIPLPLALVLASFTAAQAQSIQTDPTQFIPRADVALGYQYIHANAPPGVADSVTLNGGFLEADVPVKFWLTIAGEATVTKASDISALKQDLTLTTYTAGPRITFRRSRTVTYVQALFGGAHGSNSYFPTGNSFSTSANSFAFSVGGGLDYELSHRLALRVPEVQYLHTTFNNSVNSSQNQLAVGVGVVFKFGGHYATPSAAPAPAPVKKHIALACSANARSVMPGEAIEVTAITRSGDNDSMTFVWTSNAGTVAGTSSTASLDTTGLTPGNYHVTGHAALDADASVTASCDVPFRIIAPPVAPAPRPPLPATNNAADVEFHEHVRDVLFDYDKSNLRSDSGPAIAEAVRYLQAHPQIRVMIGGYSDERGTTEYNIALGLRRATTVRNALVDAGITPDRIQIVSYGKGAQVCITNDEGCYQRNRRAAFLMQP